MILFNYPLASMFMECLPTQWLAWWCLYQPTGQHVHGMSTIWCLYQPRASMFMECLTGKVVGMVECLPSSVKCLWTHWLACSQIVPTNTFACWRPSLTSMFLGYLLTPSFGSVSINPVTNVFVECLATHWQAFCWRIYQPSGYHK